MDVISTRQVAELLAVSEATVKRWADAGTLRCFRTPGGHRKFRMSDVADFLRTHNYEAAGPLAPVADANALAGVSSGARGDGDGAGRGSLAVAPLAEVPIYQEPEVALTFRNLALAGDVDGVVSLIAQQRLRGHTLASIFDGVVTPALVDIGERWARGVLTTTQEHMASAAVIEALARTRPLIERAARDRGKVVLAAPGEEQHDIVLRMAALLAHGAGFTPRMVGARAPASDLAMLVMAERPRLLALGATECSELRALSQDLATLSEAAQAAGTHVIVGGAGFGRIAALPANVRRASNLTEFVALMAREP